MTMTGTKAEMTVTGQSRVRAFCVTNNLSVPRLVVGVPGGGSCGLYSNNTLYVTTERCAGLGRQGSQWSWPGHIIDRTPVGVWAHELGHYVDHCRSGRARGFNFSRLARATSGEEKLTNYCPNTAEWFAEMFRLFVLNPDLLRLVRPRLYCHLTNNGLVPCEQRPWEEVLEDAPARTLAVVRKRIREAAQS